MSGKKTKLIFNRKQGNEILKDVLYLEELFTNNKLPLHSTGRTVYDNIERFNNTYEFPSFERQFKYIARNKSDFNQRRG